MGLDIRTPIGSMFLALGAILVVYGLLTNGAEMYVRSGHHNINLTWGAVLLVFGATMLFLGRRKKTPPPAARPSER
ncbi:MAG TPA: hypothetical protein PLU22_11700 [Polyangiaceae bacterium]|nr:hypothetical protein [Polyangiaceae bacterium]